VNLKTVIVVGDESSRHGRPRRGAMLTALEPVANRPIVEHVLERLSDDSDGGFIFAGDPDSLRHLRSGLNGWERRLGNTEYIALNPGEGVAGMLAAVAPIVGDAACLVQPADGMFDGSLSPGEILEHEESDMMLFVSIPNGRIDPWAEADQQDAGGVLLRSRNRLEAIDACLFAPGALSRAIAGTAPVGDDLADLSRHLVGRGTSVSRHLIDGWHRYRGDGAGLLELNRIALERLARDVPADVIGGNRIEGKVSIDPTARVESSTVVGPAIIGPGATISQAYIGPYTSIGARARIIGAEVERSIVSPGASVMHVGSRLESSLVGADTRVFRDFSLPRAVRLWAGEGDDVALC
jgi:glucose-1-phosphate thymidylyltransferase